MPAQSPHLDTTPVARNVRSLANRQNQQKCGPSGNSQLPPAKRRVSVPAGERDSTQGGSSVASTIQGQNSIPSSSLNNSRVADISQRVISTPSATQRRSINTPTATPVTSRHSTPAPGGTATRRVVCSPAFGIAITPTPLSGLENLPTLIPNPEARNHYKSTPNASYRKESETEAVAIATAGGVYTLINGLRQPQHPSIWSLRHDASCVCNGQTLGALHVEQTAVYECKRLGDCKLCNATHFESIN